MLCLFLGAPACGGASSGDQGGVTREPVTGQADSGTAGALDWTTYDVPETGVTISYPSSWKRSTRPLMPSLADPKELVALSTFPARPGGENCAHMPENAIEDMGPADALVVIEEHLSDFEGAGTLADYPERPGQFGPSDGYPSEAVDCLDQRKEFFDRFIPFRDSVRRFYAYVAFGTDTPPVIRTQAWAILDHLDVSPR